MSCFLLYISSIILATWKVSFSYEFVKSSSFSPKSLAYFFLQQHRNKFFYSVIFFKIGSLNIYTGLVEDIDSEIIETESDVQIRYLENFINAK